MSRYKSEQTVFSPQKKKYVPLWRLDTNTVTVTWNCQEMCSRRIPKIMDRQDSGGVMSQPC